MSGEIPDDNTPTGDGATGPDGSQPVSDAHAIPVPGQRPAPDAGGSRPEVAFPPVLNGLDYLASVVEHLSGQPTARDLKYAVLHLQAGTEVLLKARLQQEHWTLVLQDLGKEIRKKGTARENFAQGEFISCGTAETLERLQDVVGLDLDTRHTAAVTKLGKTRNALQHYGLTQSAHAVEAQAATVLDFLLTFIHEHLLPHLAPAEQGQVETAMEDVRQHLGAITKLIDTRMNGLKETLAPHEDITVLCPDCGMRALVAGEPVSCRFCYRTWPDAASAASDYVYSEMLRRESLDPRDNEERLVHHCPSCDVPTIVDVDRRESTIYLCLGCGDTFDDLIWCKGGCGSLVDPKTCDIDYCSTCTDRLYARF
ncbi:hypothetical protein ABZ502_17505 [Streptomyces abikoensis]|uniref:hypothetical protein n=1 Tax=Streptomyces abikoensis TaxID=97398 RepID=UPI0033DA26A2